MNSSENDNKNGTNPATNQRSGGLLTFEKSNCLPSNLRPLQGYLLEHTNFTLSSYLKNNSTIQNNQQQQQQIENLTNSVFHTNINKDSSSTQAAASAASTSSALTFNSPLTTATTITTDTKAPVETSSVVQQVVTSAASSTVIGRVVVDALRKKRWFVFTPKTGKLYKFHSQNDRFPELEIDIRTSSFIIHKPKTFPTSQAQHSQPFIFEIVSSSHNLILEANSPSEGFGWIENLQTYRQFLCNKCKSSSFLLSSLLSEDSIKP